MSSPNYRCGQFPNISLQASDLVRCDDIRQHDNLHMAPKAHSRGRSRGEFGSLNTVATIPQGFLHPDRLAAPGGMVIQESAKSKDWNI